MTLTALASPQPGALWAWLDERLSPGLVLALPLGLAGLALLRFGLLRRLGASVREPRGPAWRGAAAGLAAALALLFAVLAPPALLGAFSPGAAGYAPFGAASASSSLSSASGTFAFFALQSLAEELLFRAFLLTLLAALALLVARLFFGPLARLDDAARARSAARRWFVAGLAANALQSAGFAFLHAVNPNATSLGLVNIGLAGAVLGWLFWAEGGVLGCWSFHTLWNFALAALALPVSGMRMGTPVFATGIRGAGLPALSGGAFGPEGSLLSTAGLAVLLAILVRRSARKLASGYPPSA